MLRDIPSADRSNAGKLVTGTKAVDAQGNIPSFGKIIDRNFDRLIPFEVVQPVGTYLVKCI